jgi:hypothetical protein
MLTACGKAGTVDSPLTPSPTTSVTAVIVVTNQMINDSMMQLMATARFTDGTSRDVTATASWESSNTSIATINAAGVLTIVGNGTMEARATYQGTTGTLRLILERPPDPRTHFVLNGVSREVSPSSKILGGVHIVITSGPDTGASVTSDAGGLFKFPSVSATRITLEATKDGFQPWRMTNLMIDGDTQVEVVMFPTPPTNAAGETATARCQDSSWSWATSLAEACTSNGGLAYGVCPGPLCGKPLTKR